MTAFRGDERLCCAVWRHCMTANALSDAILL